ncbi:MAG: extracellular solute-binding protein [Rhodospirillaceae bacterium]|nr:extracellular solute-binding protein [Rhodospirillaceae bacterium]MBT5780845.1 extracellular solute-binding protein [Rhodospirillaceae bacterium]
MSHADKKLRMVKELHRLWGMHMSRDFKVSRRDLMKGMASLGLSATAISMIMKKAPLSVKRAWAVEGATPEDRAAKAAKAMYAGAKKKTISIMHPSGSGGNMSPFTAEWKALTGFDVELIEVPVTQTHQKGMQEAVAQTGRYDLMLPAPLSLPDYAESGLAHDLTDWVAKYDPEVFDGPNKLEYPVSDFGQKYKGKIYGLYCDGDWWLLNYRKDKLAEAGRSPKSKRAVVDTWAEYDQLAADMTDKGNDFWGALEYRSPFWNKFHWMTRFQSKGKLYFDKDMKSMADSPESIKTVEDLVAIQDYMPKEQFNYGFTENYAQYYAAGRGFFQFGWPSLWRYSHDAEGAQSIIAGVDANGQPSQTGISKVPGDMVNGELIRADVMPFAWDFVVNNHSEIPEVAYLYAQWLTGPTMSMRSIPNEGGYFDPWRNNHFLDPSPEFYASYPGDFLATSFEAVVDCVPEIILRGGSEYHNALDINLQAAYNGQKTPAEAMKDVAKEQNRITRRLGKDTQIEAWRALAGMYPSALQKASGADKWGM